MINRAALILKYKEPFIKWIMESDPVDKNFTITIQEANNEKTIYLISNDAAENLDNWLKDNYRNLFESELESWYIDEDLWPKGIDYAMFEQWFEVECHSVVIDTADGMIVDDEED